MIAAVTLPCRWAGSDVYLVRGCLDQMWVGGGGWSRGERLKKRKPAMRLVSEENEVSEQKCPTLGLLAEEERRVAWDPAISQERQGVAKSVPCLETRAALEREGPRRRSPAGGEPRAQPLELETPRPHWQPPIHPATLEANSPTGSRPPPDAGLSELETPALPSSPLPCRLCRVLDNSDGDDAQAKRWKRRSQTEPGLGARASEQLLPPRAVVADSTLGEARATLRLLTWGPDILRWGGGPHSFPASWAVERGQPRRGRATPSQASHHPPSAVSSQSPRGRGGATGL